MIYTTICLKIKYFVMLNLVSKNYSGKILYYKFFARHFTIKNAIIIV